MISRHLARLLIVAVASVVVPVSAAPAAVARGDALYRPYGTWNGKKVYLSPARHSDTRRRGECEGYSENKMALHAADRAATGTYYADRRNRTSQFRNLRSRGYLIRVGRGSLSSAIRNSNAWAADVHIPMHSNADYHDRCRRTDRSRFGTVVIYKSYGSRRGQGLAAKLRSGVGSSSPGTRDYICHNSSSCTRYNCLGELCRTKAAAAYLESEFHTWNHGIRYLTGAHWWAWRVGWAVDQFLRYPRR